MEIRARVEGFLEKKTYEEGGKVKAGQAMFQIDRRPFEAALQQARGALAQQEAKLTNAEATLKRLRPLAEKNAVSQKDLDDVISQNIAVPIELQVNGADNMIYMTSTSSSAGMMDLNVYFNIGTNPSLAQVDVQNRVNQALPQLPQAVTQQSVIVSKKSSSFLMITGIYSPNDRYDENYVANYVNLYILDAIKRIPGASEASIMGSPDYAMRIWLKPQHGQKNWFFRQFEAKFASLTEGYSRVVQAGDQAGRRGPLYLHHHDCLRDRSVQAYPLELRTAGRSGLPAWRLHFAR